MPRNSTALAGEPVHCYSAMLEMRLSFEEMAQLTGVEEHVLLRTVLENGTLPIRIGEQINDLRGVRIMLPPVAVDDSDKAKLLRCLHQSGGSMDVKDVLRVCRVTIQQLKYVSDADGMVSLRRRKDVRGHLRFFVAITAIGLRAIGILDEAPPVFEGELAGDTPWLLNPEATALHRALEERKRELLIAAKDLETIQSGLTDNNCEEMAAAASLTYSRITQPSELPGPDEAMRITYQGLTNDERTENEN